MLTNRAAGRSSASWRLVRGGAAIVVSAITLTSSAYAGGVGTLNCIGGRGSVSCVGQWGSGGDANVRGVPKPLGDEERAQAAARERRWLAKCEPVIERDRFGVARYHYAARGCEYGIGAD